MANIEIKVPPLGESVTEATIAKWHKKQGEAIKTDELLLELETDKITLEVSSPATGILQEVKFKEGDIVENNATLGFINEQNINEANDGAQAKNNITASQSPQASSSMPVRKEQSEAILSPAARKIAAENNTNLSDIQGSGKDGRITKSDVLNTSKSANLTIAAVGSNITDNAVERVRMTRLRKRIAERLKESQNVAAILTTFNEVDMTNIMAMRSQYKELFEKRHGVKLGFMSFFIKASIAALKEIPAVNAEIEGDDIIYKHYYHIGVAVGTEQGLVVPTIRNADNLSFADTEKTIIELGKKARDGKLTIEDLSGGTFTISNGGTYGSLLSTPIINPPQSGILGMHKIQDRPMVINGNIEIRPMMYLALSYDHRIIDGKEAVTFLVKIKEAIESPERLLLNL